MPAALPAMVPEMRPALLMLRPGGRLTALKVSGSPSASLAVSWSEAGWPAMLTWRPGLLSVGIVGSVMDQLKVVLSLKRAPSKTVTVTEYGLPAAAWLPTVPLINPVAASMLRPAGSPLAL